MSKKDLDELEKRIEERDDSVLQKLDKLDLDPGIERVVDNIFEAEKEERKAEVAKLLDDSSFSDAYALFLRYTPIAEISRITGITIDVLRYHAFRKEGRWDKDRKQINREIKDEIKNSAVKVLRETTQLSLSLIQRSLAARAKEANDGMEVGIVEADIIASIFSKIHKAKIIEEAEDEAAKIQSLTPQQILTAITEDPYLKKAIDAQKSVVTIDDSEYFEVEEENVARPSKDSRSLADPNR